MNIYTYIIIYISLSLYIYIYIYIGGLPFRSHVSGNAITVPPEGDPKRGILPAKLCQIAYTSLLLKPLKLTSCLSQALWSLEVTFESLKSIMCLGFPLFGSPLLGTLM